MKELIDTLQLYLGTKAPQLPLAVKSFIVKIMPYAVIILMLFRVAVIMALTAAPTVESKDKGPYYPVPRSNALWAGVCALGLGVSVFFLLMALPGLFYPAPDGWMYLFYAELISLLAMIMMMDFAGFIIGGLLVMLVLFQIHMYYLGTPLPVETPPVHILVPIVTPPHAVTLPGITLKSETL